MVLTNEELTRAFSSLSTALLADASLQLGIRTRIAPVGIRAIAAGARVAGHALPVRHRNSVDVVFAALSVATPGDVLVIDNGGRTDEGCVGDLIALEAAATGIAGIVLWGCHRDTLGLLAIDVPVFSYGAYPAGPRPAAAGPEEPGAVVQVGPASVDRGDVVFADDDGVMFVTVDETERLLQRAAELQQVEQSQAEALGVGVTLREQLRFQTYLETRQQDPTYTFRQHLQRIGAAIEA